MAKILKKKTTKKSKKVVNAQTYIALVIDRSGSMGGLEKSVVDGINEQIKVIRKNANKGGDTFLSYIQFDDIIETVYDKVPAKKLEELTRAQYTPRGSTSLRDAILSAIQNLKETVKETDNTAYLVIVVTDGYENSSKLISTEALAQQIKTLEATGKWTFTYMLSNIDWTQLQGTFINNAGNAGTFTSTPVGVSRGASSISSGVANYMSARQVGVTNMAEFYVGTESSVLKDTNSDNKIIIK